MQMSKIFMSELQQEERKLLLQQNADSIEETNYLKPLTPEEMDIRREELTENAIKLSEYEDEKKEAMKEFKEKMDPLVTANKLLLSELKTKQAKVAGTLFHMANHDDGMMETYDEQGELIGTRRLRPEEKQTKIFSLPKAANQ
jgi:hypothetical protein